MAASSIRSAPGLTEVGEVRATDLLLADEKTGSGSAEPVVGREFTSGTVNNYIELYAEAADVLKNTTVMFEVAKDAQARALDGAAGRVQPATADSPNRRTLEGSIPLALLPPGDYVARAVVSTDGRKVGQVTRPFRVGRTVAVVKPKPGIASRTLVDQVDRHSPGVADRTLRARLGPHAAGDQLLRGAPEHRGKGRTKSGTRHRARTRRPLR